MHAVIGIWAMDPDKRAVQRSGLHEMIIPMVRRAPGYVGGYWTHEEATSTSYSLVLFDTAEQAEAFTSIPRGESARQEESGVHLRHLAVVAVEGHDLATDDMLARA